MHERFKVIAIGGSSKYKELALQTAERLSAEGNITLLAGFFGTVEDTPTKILTDEEAVLLFRDLAMIDMCDTLFVVNPEKDIDISTVRKISYAQQSDKEIQYLVPMEADLEPLYVEALVICNSELFKNVFAPTEEDAHNLGIISAISAVESDSNSDSLKELLLRVMNEPSPDRIEYEETNTVIIKEFIFVNMLQ